MLTRQLYSLNDHKGGYKVEEFLSNNYEDDYELWIGKADYHFNTAKEAYLYYLEHFDTKEDFEYYKQCSDKELKDIADNTKLIGMVFENVFENNRHIYKVVKRADGQILRERIWS